MSIFSCGIWNRCLASISSRPLFIMVALSTEILAPIFQFGCATACAGVLSAMAARSSVRKGPPDAVRMIFSMPSTRSKSKTWKMALCSLSTGSSVAP